jgi:hypothetical protein
LKPINHGIEKDSEAVFRHNKKRTVINQKCMGININAKSDQVQIPIEEELDQEWWYTPVIPAT